MKLFLLSMLVLLPSMVTAQSGGNFQNGNKLKSHCMGANGFSDGFCMGYVIGVADSNSLIICSPGGPGGVTQGQYTDIVKKYLNENPAQLHRDADVLVLDALKKAFPCPKK